ncbi:MAG: hypothetical protein Q9172_004932 [Xanthocarpia lactea]
MFLSRHLIIPSLSILLVTLTSVAISIPNPTEASITQPSGSNTNSTSGLLNSTLRIDPTQHPDWAGVMHPSDCAKARYYFNGRVGMYNPKKVMTFWSRTWTVQPPGDEFELPFGTKYRTCTLLVRMAKDFGDDVLPNEGSGFADESDDLPMADFTLEDILEAIEGLQEYIEYLEAPAWTYGLDLEGQEAVVMFLPSSSVMARRWATDMRAGLRPVLVGVNGTVGSVG